MSQNPIAAPIPIDFDDANFIEFAKNEPADIIHVAACITTDTSGCETLLVEPVCLVYDSATKKYSVEGLVYQVQITNRTTYAFKPNVKIYAIYRLKLDGSDHRLSTIRQALHVSENPKAKFAFGIDIISDFMRHTIISDVVEKYFGRPCAVITHDGTSNYKTVGVYFGELSLTLNDASVALRIKNEHENILLKYSDVTAIYDMKYRKLCDIPHLPMVERIGQFVKYAKSEGSHIVYGDLMIGTMKTIEAKYNCDKAKGILEEQKAAEKLLEEQKAKIPDDTNVTVDNLLKVLPEIIKDKTSWTLTVADGKIKLDVNK